jgi:hypothetical protein
MVLNFTEICKKKNSVSHKGLHMAQYYNICFDSCMLGLANYNSCFVVTSWTTTTIVACTVACC